MSGLPDPNSDRAFYEQVPLLRLVAFFIDAFIVVGMAMVCLVLSFFTLIWVLPLLAFAISVAYRARSIQVFSATLGMKWLGIELRDGNGDPLDAQTGLYHSLLFTALFIIPIIPFINMIVMAVTPYGQGLHDMPFRTTAIRRPELG